MNIMCLPSGRTCGQRWVVCCPSTNLVAGVEVPPKADTFASGARKSGEYKMTSPGPHEPPRPTGASQIAIPGPWVASTFLSFPSEKYAIILLSRDQNGNVAFSVPASSMAFNESSGRTQRSLFPSTLATNASFLPSGETTTGPATSPINSKRAFGGGLMNALTEIFSDCSRQYAAPARQAAVRARATRDHARISLRCRFAFTGAGTPACDEPS